MTLTRHLYELDEVVAALQLCLRNGWSRSLFWLWELTVSLEGPLALQTLRHQWLTYGGGNDPMLITVDPGTDDKSWISLTLRIMTAIKAAGSLNAHRFLIGALHTPSRPSMTPLAKSPKTTNRRAAKRRALLAALDPSEQMDPNEVANFAISLDAACRQGSRKDTMWLLQAAQPLLSADTVWLAISTASRGPPATADAIRALQGAAGPHPLQQLLHQAAALFMLCIHSSERFPETHIHAGVYERDWAEWSLLEGRRAARIHPIPRDALHEGTTRGSMAAKYTNIGDVREPIACFAEGCRFWVNALEVAGVEEHAETGAMAFPDDDTLEAFVDTHFPDDIPDEWSRSEQEKSHGRGCQSNQNNSQNSNHNSNQIQAREEPVSLRSWRIGIAVPNRCATKKLTAGQRKVIGRQDSYDESFIRTSK